MYTSADSFFMLKEKIMNLNHMVLVEESKDNTPSTNAEKRITSLVLYE
jgi:hypothetical protein